MNGTIQIHALRPSLSRSRHARRTARAVRLHRRGRASRRGLTAIEYMFMASLIFIVILIAVQHVGNSLKASFNHSDKQMQDVGL